MSLSILQTSLLPAGADKPVDHLREKAVELEGVFLNTLVSEMFKGLETDSMFGGGHAEETWRGMMAEQYADLMARSGGIGIADQMVAALLEQQQTTSAPIDRASAIGAYQR
ncbi:rod-binding protein [Pelagibacterium sediminicola]|uniref:rod-binding protein n=1 Tax=Pelagibacterium sediminicola TaxID=2248761 RepID=UPI000E30FB1A|nr:rod-binding protein [Pelagibacterium sediminicola]